jgi:hypothetical protein
MDFDKLLFGMVILLSGLISGCVGPIDKLEREELETLRKAVTSRPNIIYDNKYMPCCMDISIIGQGAKNIFDKMPESTLLSTPTKGTCLSGDIVKISEGTMCIASEALPEDPGLYSCTILINYSTGSAQKIDINNYLNCDEED